MKKILVCLIAIIASFHFCLADEVAVMKIREGKEKKLQSVVIEFYEADAPETVANFKKLAGKRFYNGLSFHRLFPHILVQTGDPLSAKRDRVKVGTGGPGYTLAPEIRAKHIKGAVATGRLPDTINPGRRSNGSQFFICLKPMPEYNGQYTVFGRVVKGLEELDQLSTRPVDSNDNPIEKITIKSLKIVPREKAGI